MAAVLADPQPQRVDEQLPLVVGRLLRCPNCEELRDPTDPKQFKRYSRSEKYALDLNVVYQCIKNKRTGVGCGHIFSPGDQRILIAFLQGDLVPARINGNGNSSNNVTEGGDA